MFFLFLTALMVPPIFTVLPNFILIRNLGLVNTMAGMVLPYVLMTPFAIFFLRQFFLGINREVEEAAKLDGAGHFRIFFRIILPMSVPPITTLAILTFINMWNEYFWPLLVGTGEQTRVLTVALGVFKSQTPSGGPDWAGLMAATLVAAVPLLHPVPHVREEGRQLDRLLRHEVTSGSTASTPLAPALRPRAIKRKEPANDGENAEEAGRPCSPAWPP